MYDKRYFRGYTYYSLYKIKHERRVKHIKFNLMFNTTFFISFTIGRYPNNLLCTYCIVYAIPRDSVCVSYII